MSDDNMKSPFDPRTADVRYVPIVRFEKWKDLQIDLGLWEKYTTRLQKLREANGEKLKRAQQIVKRAAAIDTGAIENLYEVDRGFTFTVAMESATWEAAVNEKGKNIRSLFEAQLSAYDYVLDFATKKEPIIEAWIRKLHEVVCQSQETYIVYTELGRQEQALSKGAYKHLPNHVWLPDGRQHSYAPVEETPVEMKRYCEQLASPHFENSHTVLQTAYAHHALTVIHPFADGNGRVARALASAFTYRELSIPLLIFFDNRKEYYDTLAIADQGNFQPFVDFVLERILDSIQLVSDSLSAAEIPSSRDSVSTIKALYVTKGGFTHQEVDKQAYNLVALVSAELERTARENVIPGQLGGKVIVSTIDGYPLSRPTNRAPLNNGGRQISVRFNTSQPAESETLLHLTVEVPRDCDQDDEIVLWSQQHAIYFETRIKDLIPTMSASLQLRIGIFVDGIVSMLLNEIKLKAEGNLKKSGYR